MLDFLACPLTITHFREEYKTRSRSGQVRHHVTSPISCFGGTPWPLALVIIAALAVLLRNIAYWSTVTLTAAAIAYLAVTYGLAVLIAWEVLP